MELKIPYEVAGRKFEGLLVYDESVKAKRPAILMQPDWAGVCPNTIAQARQVAGREYVVFMADMFGEGYGAKKKTFEELMKTMRAVHEDLEFSIWGGSKALEMMLAEGGKRGLIDESKTAAVGYCAGGGLALEHARTGAKLDAVVVFHVTNPNPVDPKRGSNIKARVLVVHGSADPVTPKPMIDALEEELTKAGAPWQVMMFGGASHSFTDPTANTPGRNMYDPVLEKRSYALMRDFLAETFQK
jgi:dienelactone hydrolase